MKKVYQKPEFEVICQNQANAKFFVASFENGDGTTQSSAPQGTTSSMASSYGTDANSSHGGTNNTVGEDGGFTF